MSNEVIWKDIEDFPKYQVSNTGLVRNKKSGNLLTQKPGRDGRYLSVYLCGDDKENTQRVHRLVADAFLGKHPGMMVNHIDGDKSNNHIDNLEWCTAKENNAHAVRTGLNHPGAYQKRPVKVVETGEVFDGVIDCANTLGVNFQNVHSALQHKHRHSVNGLHFEYADDIPKSARPFLYDYQMDAVARMKNGCILNGGVGSGKSRTSLYYYFSKFGGQKLTNDEYIPMKNPKSLYVITTARKRDVGEWEKEFAPFLINKHQDISIYDHTVAVDSWNNIKKYQDVTNAFFIFDEDRVTGNGAWVKAFLKIAKANEWIILSATPGDTWLDYIPVFIANGFYKNKTEFNNEHVVYRWINKSYPKVERYVNVGRLIRQRDDILVDMDFKRQTISHHEDVFVSYDVGMYRQIGRTRTDPFNAGYIPCQRSDPQRLQVGVDISVTDVTPIMEGWDYEAKDGDYVKLVYKPIKNVSELCYLWRKVVNTDTSRQVALLEIFEDHPKMIIFYNFDYELDILKDIFKPTGVEVAEWNGHKHQPVPDGKTWVYLVQYTAGAEGWNCIKTDTIVFFSQNYSYKVMQQSAGRIDRLNTPFKDLYYYHLKSRSGIDLAISKALKEKRQFNESSYAKW